MHKTFNNPFVQPCNNQIDAWNEFNLEISIHPQTFRILPSIHKHSEFLPSIHKHSEFLPSIHKHSEFLPSIHKHSEIHPSIHKHSEFRSQTVHTPTKVFFHMECIPINGIHPSNEAKQERVVRSWIGFEEEGRQFMLGINELRLKVSEERNYRRKL